MIIIKCTVPIINRNTAQSLASLAKWLSVRLRAKWLWVRIPLLSLKLQILAPASSKEFLDIQAKCRFTLKLWYDNNIQLNIVIRNGKIVWKYGPYYWYFHLNLKYGRVFFVSLSVPLLWFMLNKIINYSSYYERSTFSNVQQTPGIKES